MLLALPVVAETHHEDIDIPGPEEAVAIMSQKGELL
jgi:hypothetical protein